MIFGGHILNQQGHFKSQRSCHHGFPGFNTKSPEERAKYDKKKVSKQAGSIMVFVDIGLLALTSYIHFRAIPTIQNNTISDYGTEITIVALGICVYIIVIGIWAAMRGFKNCKNDGTKQ